MFNPPLLAYVIPSIGHCVVKIIIMIVTFSISSADVNVEKNLERIL